MQNLHGNFTAFSVYSARHDLVLCNLVAKAELGGKRTNAPGEVRSDASSHNESNTASSTLSEINL
jgi:hypothetical protein